ncbi:zinc finger protein 41-like [Poecilia latipinna]|uniref:zinc finger protein 41-like n=1 Tax=Poecilia latipinna TaxID=48699 RepID=UPI00072EB1C3|nr:PREDICTED: zinc finger protein 41-like [Poecilia latipinna]
MDDQRRLLDFSRIPRIILRRIDCLQHTIYNEKLCNEERSFALDQEELEPLQIKEANGLNNVSGKEPNPENQNWERSNPIDFGAKRGEEKKPKRDQKTKQHGENSRQKGHEYLPRNSDLTKKISKKTCERPVSYCLQHNVYKEELCNQEELEPLQVKQEQEDPGFLQIKEEQEDLEHRQIKVEEKEVYCSQADEEVTLKQETDAFRTSPVYEKTYQTESETKGIQVIIQEAAESEKQNQERRKPFSCVICEKRFALKSVFDAHMRTHTGEKPFSCVNCEKCYKVKSQLTQ